MSKLNIFSRADVQKKFDECIMYFTQQHPSETSSTMLCFDSLVFHINLPTVFRLSIPLTTQCKAAVTTVGSENPSTFFTVRSTHGFKSSTSRLFSDISQTLRSKRE